LRERRALRLAAERRMTRASSAGAPTSMGSSGTVTHGTAATETTVVTHRDGPARVMPDGFVAAGVVDSRGRRVTQAVRGRRDGGEPPCGRSGAGEIGCRGHRWQLFYLRVAGNMIRGRGLRDCWCGWRAHVFREKITDTPQSRTNTLRKRAVRASGLGMRLLDAHLTGDWGCSLQPPCVLQDQGGGGREVSH